MLIIPVLDLMQGQVVHAIKGERQHYRPVQSTLCQSPDPDTVLKAYFNLFPFSYVYIADLDAIQGKGNHYEWIQQASKNYPDCQFWLDAGLNDLLYQSAYPHHKNILPVLGSENDIDKNLFLELFNTYGNSVLSLDFNEGGLINNEFLLQSSHYWPEKLIMMQLSRVGTGAGIDWHMLKLIGNLTQKHQVYVGGGIHSIDDLNQLKQKNATGALLATTLHNGVINTGNIRELMQQ